MQTLIISFPLWFLFVVMVLDSPFTGSIRVPPDAINEAIELFRRLPGLT